MVEYCVGRDGDILKFEGEPLSIIPNGEKLEYGSYINKEES
jgi:hypothetical protein